MATKKRVLYFIKEQSPSAEELAAAEKLGTQMFRWCVPDDGSLEECDGVAGSVPERYVAKYPIVDKAKSESTKPGSTAPQGQAVPGGEPWTKGK